MQPTEPGNPAAGEAKNWVENLFRAPLPLHDGVYLAAMPGASENEIHTSGAFSQKWTTLPQTQSDEDEGWKQYQFRWYMRCYGFESEAELAAFVRTRTPKSWAWISAIRSTSRPAATPMCRTCIS
jgi:hypothetical protein